MISPTTASSGMLISAPHSWHSTFDFIFYLPFVFLSLDRPAATEFAMTDCNPQSSTNPFARLWSKVDPVASVARLSLYKEYFDSLPTTRSDPFSNFSRTFPETRFCVASINLSKSVRSGSSQRPEYASQLH